MSILKRFESLAMELALGAGAKATSFAAKTTGSPERTDGPTGAWTVQDEQRYQEIIISALKTVESLSGLLWDGTRHIAKKAKPYDERAWQIHVLSNYHGEPAGVVAAEEEQEQYTIRNLRRTHGYDVLGEKVKPCRSKVCSVCSAVGDEVAA